MLNDKALSHPKGLYFLFFTEMMEKFSFFGMRSLLLYYITKHLLRDQAYASVIYGSYTGLVYFAAFIGGVLGDRFLGRHKSIVVGSILLIFGHFFMLFEGLFYLALLLLILGSGIFLPNISSQVGALYKPGDSRSSRAFNIIYLGTNIGAMFSTLVCGTLGEIYGWNYGFGIACIGMVIGLITYIAGQKYMPCDQNVTTCLSKNIINKKQRNSDYYEYGYKSIFKNRLKGFLILILFGILFRAVYNQQGNTLAIWVDSYADRNIFGWEMPSFLFQSLNPIMVIFFTPFVIGLWRWQNKHNFEPSSIIKMGLGCIITGVSFLLLILAPYTTIPLGLNSIFWPIMCIILLSFGEIYFVPIAVSLITQKASPGMTSMIVGIWYQSYFIGNLLSGFLGKCFGIFSHESFFFMLFLVASFSGFGIIIVSRFFKEA